MGIWAENKLEAPPSCSGNEPVKPHEAGQCSLADLVKSGAGPKVCLRNYSRWVTCVGFYRLLTSAHCHPALFTSRRKTIHFLFPWHFVVWSTSLMVSHGILTLPPLRRHFPHWAFVFLICRMRTGEHVIARIPFIFSFIYLFNTKICWALPKCQAGSWAQSGGP